MAGKLQGQQLGAWRLHQLAGSSFCSDVYLASSALDSESSNLSYVVKVVTRDSPSWARQMLENERNLLSQVSHPNVISLLDVGNDNGNTYLVLPCLEGVLRPNSRHGASPSTEWSRLAWVARQVVSGLRAVHQAGWCHGDLKPLHLSVNRNLHVTLFDLGMAQRLYSLPINRKYNSPTGDGTEAASFRPKQRTLGSLCGSPPYMAPEIFLGQSVVEPSRDIYALGCILYQWFTGVRPFHARYLAAWKHAHLYARPLPLTQWVPDLPEEFAGLVLRMLAKQPIRRPSLAEIESALVRLEIDVFGAWLDGTQHRQAA